MNTDDNREDSGYTYWLGKNLIPMMGGVGLLLLVLAALGGSATLGIIGAIMLGIFVVAYVT